MKDKLQFPFKRNGGNYLELLEDLGKDTMLGVKTVRATTRNTAIYFDDDGYTIQDAKKLASAIQDTYSDVTATADFGRNPYGEEVPFVFVDKVNSFTRESKMKKLNITKEAFEKSKYFTRKYGKLEYVSESGKLFKTEKGKILMFKESIKDIAPGIQDWGSTIYIEPLEVEMSWDDVYYIVKKDCRQYPLLEEELGLKPYEEPSDEQIREWIETNPKSFMDYLEEFGSYNATDFSGDDEYDESTKKFGRKFMKEDVGDISKDPAYVCPYCGSRNCEFDDAEDLGSGLQEGYFEGATFNAQFWCNECNKPYNVTYELKVKDVYPNEDLENLDIELPDSDLEDDVL